MKHLLARPARTYKFIVFSFGTKGSRVKPRVGIVSFWNYCLLYVLLKILRFTVYPPQLNSFFFFIWFNLHIRHHPHKLCKKLVDYIFFSFHNKRSWPFRYLLVSFMFHNISCLIYKKKYAFRVCIHYHPCYTFAELKLHLRFWYGSEIVRWLQEAKSSWRFI